MRKNMLVYNDCSYIAEKLLSFCEGKGMSVQKVVAGNKAELSAYLSGAHLMLLDIFMDGGTG